MKVAGAVSARNRNHEKKTEHIVVSSAAFVGWRGARARPLKGGRFSIAKRNAPIANLISTEAAPEEMGVAV